MFILSPLLNERIWLSWKRPENAHAVSSVRVHQNGGVGRPLTQTWPSQFCLNECSKLTEEEDNHGCQTYKIVLLATWRFRNFDTMTTIGSGAHHCHTLWFGHANFQHLIRANLRLLWSGVVRLNSNDLAEFRSFSRRNFVSWLGYILERLTKCRSYANSEW